MAYDLIRPSHHRLMLVSGRSGAGLADAIGRELAVPRSDVDIVSEGELTYTESVRGADVFIMQTACGAPAESVIELLALVQAARLASARRIVAVLPRFFYMRQDRKTQPREPVTARLVANLLETAGVDRLITADLHAGQIEGFFSIPVDHVTSLPVLARQLRAAARGPLVVVATETARVRATVDLAAMVEGTVAVLTDSPAGLAASVRGRTAILIADDLASGAMLFTAAHKLRSAGALAVYGCAPHADAIRHVLGELPESEVDGLFVTDSEPLNGQKAVRVLTVSIAPLLGATIAAVFGNHSVSEVITADRNVTSRGFPHLELASSQTRGDETE